jgi:hypothetical protein
LATNQPDLRPQELLGTPEGAGGAESLRLVLVLWGCRTLRF